MKISVCMPVIGRPQMMSQALYSVLMQGHDDVELVIQDGDPDHPNAHLPVLTQFKHVTYTIEKDRGIFDALNRCLKRSTGDILYFMCSDDMVYPGAFHAVEQTFLNDRFGGAYWVYGQTVSSDEWGQPLGIDGAPATYDDLLVQNRLGSPSVFWNRQMLNLVGFFDTRYRLAADYDMWIRMWRRRDPWFIDKPLGIFRHHEGSETQKRQQETHDEARKVSSRQQAFPSMIQAAWSALFTRQSYDGGDVPQSHDDLYK